MGFVILAIIVIAFIVVITNISVVQQSRAYVIERLGAFHSVWGVGMHFKVPFIDRIARRVSLKEQVLDYPPSPLSLIHSSYQTVVGRLRRRPMAGADGGKSAVRDPR